MGANKIKFYILIACLSTVLCLDFERLMSDCLMGKALHVAENLKCETSKGVKVQRVQEKNQTFYCIKYERKSGNRNDFDVLSFDLFDDNGLRYVK
jgi:hypothetical protein